MQMPIYTYIYIYVHMYVYVCVHIYIYIHIHYLCATSGTWIHPRPSEAAHLTSKRLARRMVSRENLNPFVRNWGIGACSLCGGSRGFRPRVALLGRVAIFACWLQLPKHRRRRMPREPDTSPVNSAKYLNSYQGSHVI